MIVVLGFTFSLEGKSSQSYLGIFNPFGCRESESDGLKIKPQAYFNSGSGQGGGILEQGGVKAG